MDERLAKRWVCTIYCVLGLFLWTPFLKAADELIIDYSLDHFGLPDMLAADLPHKILEGDEFREFAAEYARGHGLHFSERDLGYQFSIDLDSFMPRFRIPKTYLVIFKVIDDKHRTRFAISKRVVNRIDVFQSCRYGWHGMINLGDFPKNLTSSTLLVQPLRDEALPTLVTLDPTAVPTRFWDTRNAVRLQFAKDVDSGIQIEQTFIYSPPYGDWRRFEYQNEVVEGDKLIDYAEAIVPRKGAC